MFVAGVRGTTAIRFIPKEVNINAWYFVHHVLEPLVEEDILRLYPVEEHEVWLHFDSASVHTAKYSKCLAQGASGKFPLGLAGEFTWRKSEGLRNQQNFKGLLFAERASQ